MLCADNMPIEAAIVLIVDVLIWSHIVLVSATVVLIPNKDGFLPGIATKWLLRWRFISPRRSVRHHVGV